MSELLTDSTIKRVPFELTAGNTAFVKDSANITGRQWVMVLDHHFFAVADVIWFYGWNGTAYVHPIRAVVDELDIVTDQTGTYYLTIFTTTFTETITDGLLVTRGFQSDMISAVMDNYIGMGVTDVAMVNNAFDAVNDRWIFRFATDIADGSYYMRLVDANGIISYVTKSLSGGALVTGLYEYYDYVMDGLAPFQTYTITLTHIDTKYSVQVLSDGADVGTFNYTPNKDFEFLLNLKPILSSLFNNQVFTTLTDPMTSATLTNQTSVFIRKIRLVISIGSPNVANSSIMEFYTAPFLSDTGRGTLERICPPLDYLGTYQTVHNLVTPFQPTVKYLNGTNGILGYVGNIIRNRTGGDLTYTYNYSGGDPQFVTLVEGLHFVTYAISLGADAPVKISVTQSTNTVNEFAVQNLGAWNNQLNIMWHGSKGIGQWFFDCEYDEELNTSNIVSINNPINQTITNHNTTATRKLSIKSDHLDAVDIKGIATLIEAKQAWIYSYTQARIIPVKLLTNSAKVRTSDEVRYTFSLDVELERGVEL